MDGEQKEEEAPLENGTNEAENIAESKQEENEGKDDDAAIIDKLCKYIYAKAPDRIRTRAMLCHIYHHALHDRWFEARDMMLISHLQETIQHSDISTQVNGSDYVLRLGNRSLIDSRLFSHRCMKLRLRWHVII